MANPRYDSLPILRFLELYVLKAIGELPPEEEQVLDEMAPRLRILYGGDGSWLSAIEASIKDPSDLPDAIRATWARNYEIARQHNTTLTPQQFAEMFVDANLRPD